MEVREARVVYDGLAATDTDEAPAGYRRTEIGMIPVDWDIHLLGNIGKFKNGLNKGSEAFGHGTPFVNLMDVFGVSSISSTEHLGLVACSIFEQSAYGLRRGDVVFVRSSVKPSGVGLTALIEKDLPETVYSGFLIRFRDNGFIQSNFKKFCFHEPRFRRAIVDSSSVSANTNINQSSLQNLSIPLPSTHIEQEAIAEALSDADALIESLEQLIAKKRQIKQGTMQALLTGQRRLPGFMGEWLTRKFGEVAAIRRDRVDPRKSLEPEFCIELEHIGSGTGSLLGSSDAGSQASLKSVFHAGDVLFGKLRAYLRKYWFADRSGVCSTEIWCLTPKEMLHSKALLFYLVQMDEFIDAASLAYGTHMPRSDWNAVKEFVLRIPQDDEEQAAIATILTDMDTELAELETRLAKTRQLKQGMMQELLTGRIRLVQPALNVVPLPEKKETRAAAASPHNRQINEAVVIAALVKQFGSEDWPLARVRRTKLTYLLHRHAEGRADGFLKKAAGPYDPRTRYKGPEGIALKKGYVQALHNGTYEGFVASEHISDAETYFEKWYGTDVMDWLERFRLRKTDELELLTTVDMAMEDLRREGKPISVEAVRQLIHGHPEWKPKLERAIFSDDGIAAAIAECQALFAS